MPVIKQVEKETLSEKIIQQISDLIYSGELKPGDKLPTERALTTQMGVTRGRVREALRALALLGLIDIKAGDGSYVADRKQESSSNLAISMFKDTVASFEDVFEVRELIETEIALKAFKNCNVSHLDVLEKKFNLLNDASRKSYTDYIKALEDFDLYLASMTLNPLYKALSLSLGDLRKESSEKLLRVPDAMVLSLQTRNKVFQAFKLNDENEVKKALKSFFKKSREFYLTIK
ncbi:GntR family transcriptional regulator [Marinomonas sp. 15G1-11]|uniref:GntR family transcriptional regulator n=1 Tax=Marinomonas phaeophyticola TaxID=3004091 RepID=A0ABT4JX51_9GAMM|nr:GntR family transcriptional regulator [Marinomonas sp. 15G1-11]MCZ2722963.1 GntR family transcriptional regulator [Marinomonas sp. 15G1-11]